MNRSLFLGLFLLAVQPAWAAEDAKAQLLTQKEIADGWLLLFDGDSKFGWKIEGDAQVKDGVLILGGEKETTATTTSDFGECELKFQYVGNDPGKIQVRLNGQNHSLHAFTNPNNNWVQGKLNLQSKSGISGSYEQVGGGEGVGFAMANKGGAVFQKVLGNISIHVPAKTTVSLRNVKLKPLGTKAIFNGKDLTGWKEIKGGRYKSKFTVTDKREMNIQDGPGDIHTEDQWDNFVLQLDIISHGKHLNSGVFFRCLPGQFWSGYEAQIRNQWQGNDRTKPVDYGTGGIYNRQPARKVVSSDKEWFTMTVAANGKHMAVWVNGYQVSDFTDPRKPNKSARNGVKVDKGPISLQGHDKTTNLSFRNIRIAELPTVAK